MAGFIESLSEAMIHWDDVEFAALHRHFKNNKPDEYLTAPEDRDDQDATEVLSDYIDRLWCDGGGMFWYPMSVLPYLMTGCPTLIGKPPYPPDDYLIEPQSEVA